jgi:hypothetical protein
MEVASWSKIARMTTLSTKTPFAQTDDFRHRSYVSVVPCLSATQLTPKSENISLFHNRPPVRPRYKHPPAMSDHAAILHLFSSARTLPHPACFIVNDFDKTSRRGDAASSQCAPKANTAPQGPVFPHPLGAARRANHVSFHLPIYQRCTLIWLHSRRKCPLIFMSSARQRALYHGW